MKLALFAAGALGALVVWVVWVLAHAPADTEACDLCGCRVVPPTCTLRRPAPTRPDPSLTERTPRRPR